MRSTAGAGSSTLGGRRSLAQSASQSADVIVVGAGIAGIAAARAIADKLGNSKVMVLEGRNRIGGRCWTTELAAKNGGSVKADLGAAWIHGLTNNVVTSLASTHNIALASRKTDYDNTWLFLPNGNEASGAQETKWEATFEEFEEVVADKQWDLEGTSQDVSLGTLATRFINRKGLAGMDKLAFLHMANTNIEHEYAGALGNLSLWFDYGANENGGDKFVTGGYQKLVESMAKNLDVRLEHTVTKITYSSTSTISLTVTGKGTFSAKRVVVAVPLGVLKRNVIQFAPALPAANTKALGQLEMGLLNKLIMVFDSIFWEEKDIEVLNRIAPDGNGAWSETFSMWPITGEAVLVAFNAAEFAWKLEGKTSSQVKDEYMAVLRTMFDNVPEPRSYVVTAWGQDPYSYGSYSYTKQGVPGDAGYEKAHEDCAKSINNRIFFAGEHTRADHPATTHGAVLSGRKAATDLLNAFSG